jgi:hypothetical protein
MKNELLERIRHVGLLRENRGPEERLILVEKGDEFVWMRDGRELLRGKSVSEMIQRASGHFAGFPVRLVDFGFWYSLPERDEVGRYALFPKEGRKIIQEFEAYVES